METAKKLRAAMKMDVRDVFKVDAGGTLSERTIWHHHKLVCLILNVAKKERIIPHNVAPEHMDGPRCPRTEAKYLDDEQAQAFLVALSVEPDIRKKMALTLDLFTGVRRGELCGLSWPDIDFESGTVHIRRASQYQKKRGITETSTKNAFSVRSLTVAPHVLSLLSEYRRWWLEQRLLKGSDWAGEKERLFIQKDGKPISPDTINGWLTGILEKHGFPHITVHSLRHTFATLQLAAGVDIRTLQARTGHAQASTLLDVYSHVVKSAQDKAAQTLDDVLLSGLPKRAKR